MREQEEWRRKRQLGGIMMVESVKVNHDDYYREMENGMYE
jgi:hypothetical protein